MGRGRNPKLSEAELVDGIGSITSPAYPVADTQEVQDRLEQDVTGRTVRDTLAGHAEDSGSRISGRTPGDQKGWVWWVVPETDA
jgi:hypothetical protein